MRRCSTAMTAATTRTMRIEYFWLPRTWHGFEETGVRGVISHYSMEFWRLHGYIMACISCVGVKVDRYFQRLVRQDPSQRY
jgi:hypothetical protein